MDFQKALTHIKNLKRVTRFDDSYICYRKGSKPYLWLVLIDSEGKEQSSHPWAPTEDDLLSDDWRLV